MNLQNRKRVGRTSNPYLISTDLITISLVSSATKSNGKYSWQSMCAATLLTISYRLWTTLHKLKNSPKNWSTREIWLKLWKRLVNSHLSLLTRRLMRLVLATIENNLKKMKKYQLWAATSLYTNKQLDQFRVRSLPFTILTAIWPLNS